MPNGRDPPQLRFREQGMQETNRAGKNGRREQRDSIDRDGRSAPFLILVSLVQYVIQNLCRTSIPTVRRIDAIRTLRKDYAWLTSDDSGGDRGFTFREACEFIDLDPEKLREMVLPRMDRRVMQEAGIEVD